MKEAKAFAPAHITGFFAIHDKAKDLLERGSTGAGFSIELGIKTKVILEEADVQEIHVFFNGKEIEGNVTKTVINLIFSDSGINKQKKIYVEHTSPLPIGAGFGLSAAGAISTALALSKVLNLKYSLLDLGKIAHRAEIINKTGLGDVIAEIYGGFEIRKHPGAPGIGLLDFLVYPANLTMIAAVLGPISTKKVLSNQKYRDNINRIGNELVQRLLEDPSYEYFLELSHQFSENSGLLTNELRQYIKKLKEERVLAAMVMIGKAIFTLLPEEDVSRGLTAFKKIFHNRNIFVSKILSKGAKLL